MIKKSKKRKPLQITLQSLASTFLKFATKNHGWLACFGTQLQPMQMQPNLAAHTWRIIPWLGYVVNNHGELVSPLLGVMGPFPNDRTSWLINGSVILSTEPSPGMILKVGSGEVTTQNHMGKWLGTPPKSKRLAGHQSAVFYWFMKLKYHKLSQVFIII